MGAKPNMATATEVLFGSGNRTENEIDVVDIVALVILPTVAGMIFNVFSFSIDVFGGYDLTQAIWTVSGIDISVAFLLAVLAPLWVILTNLANKQTDQSGLEYALILLAILLPALHVIVPAVADLVMWHDVTQLAAWLYVSVATIVVSYMG